MEVRLVKCSRAASRSGLPGLDWAVNPYRGCVHACAYCYAQDVTRFEPRSEWGSVVAVKTDIVQRLKRELGKDSSGVFGVGTVTDPYQPLEEAHRLTRGCLVLLKRFGAKASVLTKSGLVLRDMDVFEGWDGAEVGMSIGSTDEGLCRVIEPNAPSPESRFRALATLTEAGVDTYLMAAPVLPGLSDSDEALDSLVRSAAGAGVRRIMWDGWNPKPMASARLGRVLGGAGLEVGENTEGWRAERNALLDRLCRSAGIELSYAF